MGKLNFRFSDLRQVRPAHVFRWIKGMVTDGWYYEGDPSSKDRFRLLMNSYSGNIVGNLIGGSFYTGLLLLMQADDGFIGLMSMLGTAINMFQMFAPLILERFEKRKKILLTLSAISQTLNILLIGLIPLFPIGHQGQLSVLAVTIVTINLIGIINGPGTSVWHLQSLPPHTRNSYFSLVTLTTGLLTTIVNLTASWVVDSFRANGMEYQGILLLRIIAAAIAAVNLFSVSRIKEYPYENSGKGFSIKDLFIKPFKEKLYLRTIAVLCLWNFTANIPGSYFSIYLLGNLDMSYTYLTLVSSMNIPIVLLFTPIWSKMIRKRSHFTTFYLTMSVYLLNYILQAFVIQETTWLYVVAMFIVCVMGAGINLLMSSIAYVNIPSENQTVHLAFYSTMGNISALLGVTVGREFILATEGINITLLGIEMVNKQYILLLTAGVMIISTICIFLIQRSLRKHGQQS
ncbi:MAG: MFS transporter [Clostridiales bacterium]|nr:MFS transporter [Clostridiales bacterium]